MQELINATNKQFQVSRSLTQMTLGRFIKELEKLPQDKEIDNICNPHSYRGYYSDLAFETESGTRSVRNLVKELKNKCLRKTFKGYKGGDFYMSKDTPLWVSAYGRTGLKIIDIEEGEIIQLIKIEDN